MHKILKDSVISTIFQLLKIFARFFVGIYIVKNLELNEYAAYNLFLLFMTFGSTIFSFNIHEYFNINISQSKDIKSNHHIFWTTMEILLISSIFFTFILNLNIISSYILDLFHIQKYHMEYQLILILISLTTISMTIIRYLAFSKYILFFQIWTFLIQVSWTLAFVFLEINLEYIFYSQIIMLIFLISIGLLYIYFKENNDNLFHIKNLIPDISYLKKSISFGFTTYIAVIGSFFLEVTDKVMLSILSSNNNVAYYSFSSIPFNILTAFIIGTAFLIAMPYINELDVNNKEKKYNLYIKLITSIIIYLSGILLIISLLANKIVLFLGTKEYLQTADVFPLISIITLFILISMLLKHELILNKSLKKLTFIYISAIIINVIINFYVIPLYGYTGAFFSTLITQLYITGSLFINTNLSKYIKVNFIKIGLFIFTMIFIIIIYEPLSSNIHIYIKNNTIYLFTMFFLLYSLYLLFLYFCNLIPKDIISSVKRAGMSPID